MALENQAEGFRLALQIHLNAEKRRQPLRRIFNDATVGVLGGSLLGATTLAIKYFAEGNAQWSLLSVAVGVAGLGISGLLPIAASHIENRFLRLPPEEEARFRDALNQTKQASDNNPPQNPPAPNQPKPPFRPLHPSGYPVRPTSNPPALETDAAAEPIEEETETIKVHSKS